MIRDPSDGSVRDTKWSEDTKSPAHLGPRKRSEHGSQTDIAGAASSTIGTDTSGGSANAQVAKRQDSPMTDDSSRELAGSVKHTSGLPLESQKPERIAKLEKSREWLIEYFKLNPRQGT
jgi:hypothetical protein